MSTERFELIAPCHFGLEAVLKREILDLGYEISKVEDGKVTFLADAQGIADANVFLRTTERILLKVAEVKAETFDELFEATKALPWERYIPADGKFWIAKANSVKSKLFSPSDIQSIMKKAIVERLKGVYNVSWFPEDGASFPIRVAFMKDVATIGIDTSGVSLHKRGYRQMTVKAPITETLASALIMLTPWNKDRILVDPFCGSGTFPIEAAMIAADMAPGMNRSFLAEDWKHLVPRKYWYDALEEAQDRVNLDIDTDIQGYDIDPEALKSARANAKMAGVDKLIHFQQRAVKDLSHPKPYGFIITNPPYGERISTNNLLGLYQMIGERLKHAFIGNTAWVLSYREECFDQIGLKPTAKIPLFNGALECEFRKYEIFDGKYKEFKKQEGEGEGENEESGFKSREPREFKPRESRKPGEFKSRDDRPREFRPRDSKPREFGSKEDRPRGEFKPREFRKDGDRERKPFDRERRPGGSGEFKPKREFKPRKREDGE